MSKALQAIRSRIEIWRKESDALFDDIEQGGEDVSEAHEARTRELHEEAESIADDLCALRGKEARAERRMFTFLAHSVEITGRPPRERVVHGGSD